MIHLSVPVAEFFGAGTCGKYLLREFAKRGAVSCDPMGDNSLADPDTQALLAKHLAPLAADVDAPLIQFAGPELNQQTKYRGHPNVGYVFSEWEPITEQQRENLRAFDVLVAGSTWNANVIRAAGFECAAVPQGVDREIFRPGERARLKDDFVIYSGGKFEHRKAQDLVIRAVKILQQRHQDILLVASWFNIWENDYHYADAKRAGLRFVTLPLMVHAELAAHMNQTDVGLFPNRCEGGTNLMLMDYLACGKPVVANVSTGQRDVLDTDYAFCIEGRDDELVEQMVNSVEQLYRHRDVLKDMGRAADGAMNDWPWSRTADGLEASIAAT